MTLGRYSDAFDTIGKRISPAGLSDMLARSHEPSRRVIFVGDSMWGGTPPARAQDIVRQRDYDGASLASSIDYTAPVSFVSQGSARSGEIGAFIGALPLYLTLTGNSLPDSGGVTVTALTHDALYSGGKSGNGSMTGKLVVGSASYPATLAGSGGAAGRFSATYTLARTTPGSAVSVSASGALFVPDRWATIQHSDLILRVGANNILATQADRYVAVQHICDIVRRFQYAGRRALVLDTLNQQTMTAGTPGHTAIVAFNRALERRLGGDVYVPIREYICGDAVYDAAYLGLIGSVTPDDVTAIANDAPPPSLMSDNTHGAFDVTGYFLSQTLRARGWTHLDDSAVPLTGA